MFHICFLSDILLCCCHYPSLLTYLGLLAKIQHGSMKVYELTDVTYTNSMVHIISQHTVVIFFVNALYTFKAHGVTTSTTFKKLTKFLYFIQFTYGCQTATTSPNTLTGRPSYQIQSTSCMQTINVAKQFKLNPGFNF